VVVNLPTNVPPVPPATFSATLSLVGAPQITTQPVSQAVAIGSNVTFSVVATGDAPFELPMEIQRQHLSGKTAPTLTLNNVQPANDGNYTVVVSTRSARRPASLLCSRCCCHRS